MQEIFQHEDYCGACELVECPDIPACARREDSTVLLRCEQCPAAYHYCCAGYYDSADGPASGDRWVCWRCAHEAPGGFKRNWVVPSASARPGSVAYISEESAEGEPRFHKAYVVSSHGSCIVVQFQSNATIEPRTENIALESTRVWHGSMSQQVWDELPGEKSNDRTFIPKSRKYCPPSFKKIAEQHGVPVPAHVAQPKPLFTFHDAGSSLQQPRQAEGNTMRGAVGSGSHSTRRGTRAGQSSTALAISAEDASSLEDKGRTWIDAVRQFGIRVKDSALANIPEFMSLRKDLFVHSYAVWMVVMAWGGEEVVCENKLWSALAAVFDAPSTMTNRAQKMKQVWNQFHLARLTKSDAQSFSEVLEVPPIDGDLLFSKSHPVMQHWPGCKMTTPPEGGKVARASKRGATAAAGTSAGAPPAQNGCATVKGAPRAKARGKGAPRGRKRMRSVSDSDHDRSVEVETSPEPFEEEEEEEEEAGYGDSEPEMAARSPTGVARVPPAKKKGTQHGRKQSNGGRSRTDSGQTELSEDDDDVGGGRRGGERAASPQQQADDSDDPDGAAGAMLVAEGASRLRRMPMSALPPKLPPGLDLPDGAISAEFARRLRLGDYMIRLDSSCIHTSLQPREPALEFARQGLRGESPKIQFVSTEKDYLGGWWDATLRGSRTGSVLEGGARFLVEENYPGDPDDPYPQTWVPLVYYGPQPYPFQTPQVMLRPVPGWKPAESREEAPKVKVGELVEAVDVPEEQEDTVFWRGCVHELKSDGQVVVRLLVAPYGNAGVSTDPEEAEGNYQTHPPERVRKAPVDDLMGMVREPSDDPERAEIRALATTDQMELQVLQHTKLIVGRYAGGKAVVAIEAHATFKTAQAAHPDDQELAKVIKNRKASTARSRKRSPLHGAISSAYKARVAGKPPKCAAKKRSSNATPNGGQQGGPNGGRTAASHSDAMFAHASVQGMNESIASHMRSSGVAPLQSQRSLGSGGADGDMRRHSEELQQQLGRQQSIHDGRICSTATLDAQQSGVHMPGRSALHAASPSNAGSPFPGTHAYSDPMPRFGGDMPIQPTGFYAEGNGSDWELNALAQMAGVRGPGVQYGGMPNPQQLLNGGHVQRYVNSSGGISREGLAQWGEHQTGGQLTQHRMSGQGMGFPGTWGPHG